MSVRRMLLAVAWILCTACLAGTVAATSLGTDWSERTPTDSPYTGVQISADGSIVFAGGNQMLVRSWSGNARYAGRAGYVAALSPDGNYAVSALGESVNLLNNKGELLWSRNMPAPVRAVAVSRDASTVVSADDKGNYNSWAKNGDFYGRTTDNLAKKIAISRTGDLIVATTEGGLRYYDGALNTRWSDNRSGSLDTYIAITGDGSTVITAGGTRVSSHTSDGTLNWMKEMTKDTIIDMACAEDGSAILVGGQDSTVTAIDRYGIPHWTYATGGQWVRALGCSRDASVIAAGSNDGTVYVLDHGGSLLTKRKMDAAIQPQSLAVSRDGTRIAVSDQYHVSGLSVIGDRVTEGMVTYTSTPLNPVARYTKVTTVPETSPVLMVQTTEETPAPATPEQKSPVDLLVPALALAGAAGILVRKRIP